MGSILWTIWCLLAHSPIAPILFAVPFILPAANSAIDPFFVILVHFRLASCAEMCSNSTRSSNHAHVAELVDALVSGSSG